MQYNLESDNSLLSDKVVLQYPLTIASKITDEDGQPAQYVMIKIRTDENATKLVGDSSLGQAYTLRAGTRVGTSLVSSKNDDADMVKLWGSAETVNKENWRVLKGVQRLNKVIILPMPSDHVVSTSMRYSEMDASGLTKAGDMINQLGSGSFSDMAQKMKSSGISGLVNATSSVFGGGPLTSEAKQDRESGVISNSRTEKIFESFDFRTFPLRYSFNPKNQIESDMVNKIIQTLRYYSLPELKEGKTYYILPSEFEIEFMLGDKINPNIPRIATSALQRISVNYSPKSIWATLPNASPVSIDVTLEFMELELIDRTRIYNKNGSMITTGY